MKLSINREIGDLKTLEITIKSSILRVVLLIFRSEFTQTMDTGRRLESSLEITDKREISTPPVAFLFLDAGKGSSGKLSRCSSVTATEETRSYRYEGGSDVIYLKSDLLKGSKLGGRARPSRSAPSKPKSPPKECPRAASFMEDHRFSKSQMVSPKQTDHDLWTLWLSELKNSSN